MAIESPKCSFQNFKLSKNFFSSLKALIISGVGIVLSQLVFNNIIADGLSALVLNMIVRGLEFYFKKYE